MKEMDRENILGEERNLFRLPGSITWSNKMVRFLGLITWSDNMVGFLGLWGRACVFLL